MSIWKKASAALEFLPKQNCGDRSLDDLESTSLCYENQWAVFRDHGTEQSRTNLQLCYKILIAPVAELLTEPKIIIVPDSCLYQIPFAALSVKGGEYLSEAFGLRIVPSLTTLKLVLDSSHEYYRHTNAPADNGWPCGWRRDLQGKTQKHNTIAMCKRGNEDALKAFLGVISLIGDCATKQDVLQGISSVSLIHIAAHGGTDRGEIALSPKIPTSCIPPGEDYH